jgi:pimeloyl-ACP methyl ester carboxylesterase
VQHRETSITVGGIKTHCLAGGSGPPLVVLHGASGNAGWRRWIDALAERYTIWAPTHPGFGQSDSADWMESIVDLARFYLWLLDEAGLERVHLLGNSIGGWLAAELATIAPSVVDRLVLVSPAGLKPEQGEIRDIFYLPPEQMLPFTYFDREQVPERKELFGAPPTPEQRDIQLRNREQCARLVWKPYMYNPRLPHYLPRVDRPTLIVWGAQDQIIPPICGEQYQRLMPNARLELIDRCGHLPQIEQPEAFVRVVGDFLDEA